MAVLADKRAYATGQSVALLAVPLQGALKQSFADLGI